MGREDGALKETWSGDLVGLVAVLLVSLFAAPAILMNRVPAILWVIAGSMVAPFIFCLARWLFWKGPKHSRKARGVKGPSETRDD